jgi:hypothetical protein
MINVIKFILLLVFTERLEIIKKKLNNQIKQ